MIRKLSTTALALTLAAAMVTPAMASQKVPAEMQAKIRTHLTEQGYEVRKIKSEDGLIEAYVLKDGKKMEIYLDANMQIVRTKGDD